LEEELAGTTGLVEEGFQDLWTRYGAERAVRLVVKVDVGR